MSKLSILQCSMFCLAIMVAGAYGGFGGSVQSANCAASAASRRSWHHPRLEFRGSRLERLGVDPLSFCVLRAHSALGLHSCVKAQAMAPVSIRKSGRGELQSTAAEN